MKLSQDRAKGDEGKEKATWGAVSAGGAFRSDAHNVETSGKRPPDSRRQPCASAMTPLFHHKERREQKTHPEQKFLPNKSLLGVTEKVSYQHALEPTLLFHRVFLCPSTTAISPSVFHSRGSCNKGPPTGGLQTTDRDSLTVWRTEAALGVWTGPGSP